MKPQPADGRLLRGSAPARPVVAVRHGRLVRLSAPAAATAPIKAEPPGVPAQVVAPSTRAAILLFICVLFVPSVFFLGPIALPPALLYLAIGFLPLLTSWLSGRAGPRTATDLLVLGFASWAFLTRLLLLDIGNALEPAGVVLLQTAGAYFTGRVLVRNAAATRLVFAAAMIGVAVLLPFLLWESVTGSKPLLDLAALFSSTLLPTHMDPRWGFHRAQGVFEHPILLGMFAATLVSAAVFMFPGRQGRLMRWLGAPAVILAAMTSLSTGALLSMNIQFGLMLWNAILRTVQKRWTILISLVIALYIAADLLSDRTPFHLFVDYATFSAQSSYNRILIWQFGSAAVMDSPLLGHGTDDWERPAFMHASMDNFWLVIAYRYGLPGFILLAAAFVLSIWRIAHHPETDPERRDMRRGVIFSLIATMIAAVSVHLWNNSYIWLMFALGAVSWMTRTDNGEPIGPTPTIVEPQPPQDRHARLRRLGF